MNLQENVLVEKVLVWKETLGLPTHDDGFGLEPIDEALSILIFLLHKSLGGHSKVWGNKLHRYWGAFIGKVQLAANAPDLPEFCHQVVSEMKFDQLGRYEVHRQVICEILGSFPSKQRAKDYGYKSVTSEDAVNHISRKYQVYITYARVLNQQLKDEYYEDESDTVESASEVESTLIEGGLL